MVKKLKLEGYCDQNKTLTPTEKHLLRYSNFISNYDNYATNSDLYALVKQIINKEREFINSSYYTFIHAQARPFYFLEKLYTFLWECRKKTHVPDDFLFLHMGPAPYPLLWMNFAFFANSSNRWASISNSAHFIQRNFNTFILNNSFSIKKVFSLTGFEKVLCQFEKELKALEQEFLALSNYGNVFLIAIPKEKINEYAYKAFSKLIYGKNVRGFIADKQQAGLEIEGIGNTNDLNLILEAILNHPEKIKDKINDICEFCLHMTDEAGLNPRSGIKMFPFVAGNQKKLAELETRAKDLFNRIAISINVQENQLKMVNRSNTLLNHLVL